jgi:hypothetical protein
MMQHIHDGQCGPCAHFGEHHPAQQELVQTRINREAPEDIIDACGHPRHASLHLMATPIGGCDGFEPARQLQ